MTILRHDRNVRIKQACIAILIILLAGFPSIGYTTTPFLVRDINTTVVPANSNPQYLGVLGNIILFGASDASGAALWAIGATDTSPVLLRRLNVIAQTTFPGSPNYIVMQNRGYFIGDDGVNGMQLWSTDGTSTGTKMVSNLGPSGTTASPYIYGVVGSLLTFSKVDAAGTSQMYATDGTSAGTHALTNLSAQSFVTGEFLAFGNKFYFVTGAVSGGISIRQIWVSDGTQAGTHQVSNPTNDTNALYNPHLFASIGNAFIYASQGMLWKVDVATDTISAITVTTNPGGLGPDSVNEAAGLIGMDGYVLCIAAGSTFGSLELWRSDGTSNGTYRVAVTDPGPASFNAQQYPLFHKVGNRVLFIGRDSQYGSQLWSSDGTSANTFRLTNASEPSNSAFQIAIYEASIANTAYLAISDGAQTTTWSVWRTDGTTANTQRVGGLPSFDQSTAWMTRVIGDGATLFFEVPTSSSTSLFKYLSASDTSSVLKSNLPISLTDGFFFNAGSLYFSVNDSTLGDEPWISNGTADGTRLIADINPQTKNNDSSPDEFVNFNGALVYVADDGVHGRELWRSDGTTAGTILLADVNPGPPSSNPSHLYVANNTLYFFATDASGKSEFMSLSASSSLPQTLANLSLPPFTPPFLPPPACISDAPVTLNGKTYFGASDDVSGVELWATDGTSSGTRLVDDINPGLSDSNPCGLTIYNGKLYFSATGMNGNELWTSDGTSAGTSQVIDIASGAVSSSPAAIYVFNDSLYFTANDGTHGSQLWKSNGLASGTSVFGDIVQNANSYAAPAGTINGKLLIDSFLYQSQSSAYQSRLWVSDGTSSTASDLGAIVSGATPLFINSGLVYFGSPGSVGIEPWVSDGTPAGTHLLKDINPSAQSSLLWFADFNGLTLFAAYDPSLGEQLWRSDGTSNGTTLISSIPTDAPSISAQSHHHRLTVGQTFFFVGNDSSTGTELYAISNVTPVASAYSVSSTNDQPVAINVLANDSDSDGSLDASSVRVLTNPSHGTTIVGLNGTITYTPTTGFTGTDNFTYTISDNQGAVSNIATITVTATSSTVIVTGSRGGGGGGLDALGLGVLLMMWIARLFGMSQRKDDTASMA